MVQSECRRNSEGLTAQYQHRERVVDPETGRFLLADLKYHSVRPTQFFKKLPRAQSKCPKKKRNLVRDPRDRLSRPERDTEWKGGTGGHFSSSGMVFRPILSRSHAKPKIS